MAGEAVLTDRMTDRKDISLLRRRRTFGEAWVLGCAAASCPQAALFALDRLKVYVTFDMGRNPKAPCKEWRERAGCKAGRGGFREAALDLFQRHGLLGFWRGVASSALW